MGRLWVVIGGLMFFLVACSGGVDVPADEPGQVVESVTVAEVAVTEPPEETETKKVEEETSPAEPYEVTEDMYVYKHGPLRVEGTQLVDQHGQAIQLRGISTHGVHYQGSLINAGSIGTLVNDWQIKVLRAAMYIEEDGYKSNPDYNRKKLEDAVMLATYYGIYTIVDWHVHYDQDPMKHVELAKVFFDEISAQYANHDNVLYEICNEPNGNQVTWDNNIKPYAEIIIPIIRKNDPDAVIIVGTGSWSQDLPDAADNPLAFDNVMYTCHFYAGSHGQELRDNVQYALDHGAPVFVTEWGTSASTGSGGVFAEASDVWLDFLDERKISWANWSLAALPESSAILYPNTKTGGNWTDDRITESGHYLRDRLLSYDQDF